MAQVFVCREQLRNQDGDNYSCDGTAVDLGQNVRICSRKDDHVLHMKTGYCFSKWCEGTKPRSYSGASVPTCHWWLRCPCECHAKLSEIFKLTGQERRLVDNPEYVPAHITGLMTYEERAQMHAELKEQARTERVARMVDQPDGGDAIHSPSGRTRKGLLDEWVELHCKMWSMNPDMFGNCTPGWLSEQIATMHDVPAPSHGAVDAVLRRWVAVGYATMEGKPVRFTGFTEEGKRLGLDVLKEKRRLQQAGVRR